MERKQLEAVTVATQYVVDHIEQLAGVAEDLRALEHDPEVLCNRGVARLQRLPSDLADLRQGLAGDVADALSSRYNDLVEWGGKERGSYCAVTLAIGEDLYTRVTLCLPSAPADDGSVDETALRAEWGRIAGVLDEFADRVPWRTVDNLRARATAELDWAVVPQQADDDAKPAVAKKRETVDDRMKAELASNLEAVKGFTKRQWAELLGCGDTTVFDAPTWKSLSLLRQQAKVEKRRDRHGTKRV